VLSSTPLVAIAASGLIIVNPGPALAAEANCGDIITANTILHNDLTDCPGDGIVIGADNITLDLNRHTIDGDAVQGADRLDDGIHNDGHGGVTIENGTIREFDRAVALDAASHNRLHGLTTTLNSGRAINVDDGSNANHIYGNTASNNGRSGIALLSSDYNLVENNTLSGNVVAGMGGFTVRHSVIRHNVVSDNGDNGIFWGAGSEDNRIEDNTISGSPGFGVAVGGARNVVSRNHLVRNCVGILVSGEDDAIVANVVTDAVSGADFACGTGIIDEGGTRNMIALNSVARTLIEGIRVNAYEPDTPPAIGIVIRANIVRQAGTDGDRDRHRPRRRWDRQRHPTAGEPRDRLGT
jgi:parallel beta-helix repeat protein